MGKFRQLKLGWGGAGRERGGGASKTEHSRQSLERECRQAWNEERGRDALVVVNDLSLPAMVTAPRRLFAGNLLQGREFDHREDCVEYSTMVVLDFLSIAVRAIKSESSGLIHSTPLAGVVS